MDVRLEDEWHPSTKLNAIGAALDVASADPLPSGVTRDQIEESCYTLQQLYGGYVDDLVADTELSRREAQTWVLRNLVYEGAEPLSYEAIGLYIWAIGRATEGDPLSRTIVTEYYDRAQAKIDRAEATVMRTGPPPYPDEVYEDPTVIWVEEAVGQRLARRLEPEETFSELLTRLLDETAEAVPIEDVIVEYRDDHDSEYAAVDTVYPGWDRTLRLIVDVGDLGQDSSSRELSVIVDGTPVNCTILEREDLTPGTSHIPVLGPGSGTADPEDGSLEPDIGRLVVALEGAERTPSELVEALREAGAVGLAVGDQPTGSGAHLYPLFEGSPQGDPLYRYLDRLELDDRTIAVSEITPLTVDEFDTRADSTTVLWAEPGHDSVPAMELPAELSAQRERFPNPVLWTA